MPPYIRIKWNPFAEVEKMLRYRFGDKERERSNRARKMADLAVGTRRRCPMRHDMIAWSGPPHDPIRTYICLRCNGCACEPELKDRGYPFELAPDWIIHEIMDLDLERQGQPQHFFPGFQAPAE